jgi:hypothetical protein
MLTPQTSQLYLAALLQEAGFEHLEALHVAGKVHGYGCSHRTGGEQRAVLENEMRFIRDKALTHIEAITRVIDEHYYCDVSADVEEDLSLLEWRRQSQPTTPG